MYDLTRIKRASVDLAFEGYGLRGWWYSEFRVLGFGGYYT